MKREDVEEQYRLTVGLVMMMLLMMMMTMMMMMMMEEEEEEDNYSTSSWKPAVYSMLLLFRTSVILNQAIHTIMMAMWLTGMIMIIMLLIW